MEKGRTLLLQLFRWTDTSPEDFRKQYLGGHADIIERFAGVTWCEGFVSRNPEATYPVMSAPFPEALTFISFASEEALDKALASDAFKELEADLPGFAGYMAVSRTRRVVWIPAPNGDTGANGAITLFAFYRWNGKSMAQTLDHYANSHSILGRRQPGILAYQTFLDVEGDKRWPRIGFPMPEGFSIEMFENEQAMLDLPNHPMWEAELVPDCQGFVAHTPMITVDRYVFVKDKEPARVYQSGPA